MLSKKILLSGELRAEEVIMNISSEMEKLCVLNNDMLENYFHDNYKDTELAEILTVKFFEFKTKARIIQDYICAVKEEFEELQEVTANA